MSGQLFEDLGKIAGSAAGVLAGMKTEIETLVRQRVERAIAALDLVTREEFEVVKAMAIKAREEQEKLEARIKELEGK